MARPRTVTNLLEMRNAYKKHPERRKEREFEPKDLNPLGACPDGLGDLVQKAWNDLSKPAAWLREADRPVVERAAVLLAALRCGEGDSSTEKAFQGYVRMLGLPATERSKVISPKVKPANKYANLG